MITKRQREVLEFIRSYSEEVGIAPSLEEIKKHFKMASVSTAHHHVKKLQEVGLIFRDPNQPRAMTTKETIGSLEIPILGSIAAGTPIEAIEIPEETIRLSLDSLPSRGDYYALRVVGDSMIDEGILNDDIIVVKNQKISNYNGQTVVAVIDNNEATLKKLYAEQDRFRLQPANNSFKPIYRTKVDIRGIVVKIIRELETRNN